MVVSNHFRSSVNQMFGDNTCTALLYIFFFMETDVSRLRLTHLICLRTLYCGLRYLVLHVSLDNIYLICLVPTRVGKISFTQSLYRKWINYHLSHSYINLPVTFIVEFKSFCLCLSPTLKITFYSICSIPQLFETRFEQFHGDKETSRTNGIHSYYKLFLFWRHLSHICDP